MSLPKSELSEILNAMGNVLTRLVDRVENDHEFQPYERRAILNTMYEKMCGVQMQEILDDANKDHNLVPKRGDGAVNDAYTGVPGEITVDMDAKTVRVHDGETTGGIAMARVTDVSGDSVIETQLPTAENNYTWYRKYKSGWVEMGGYVSDPNTNGQAITLPITMSNTYYTVIASSTCSASEGGGTTSANQRRQAGAWAYSDSVIYVISMNGTTAASTPCHWYVCGLCKQ